MARPQETIEIYSGEQLKGSSIDPVLVSKYNPVEIVHTGDNSLDLALGKPLDVFVAIAINLQPQTSAGYFPALPVGAPRDRLVWESIGRNLELDLNFVDDEGGAKYAASAQDSRYSGNTVSLTLRTQNNKYVVDASYKPHPSHVTDLTQQLAGLDAQVVRDDPSLSSQARGFINHVQVHFDVGKAHHVYTYLKRVLGK
ncbi:hypothetical protein HYX06_05080 [Candidatus Woesearchaeota archaeon]|nr:hypothetical protein [Candidatus Woesearchaeota archaeon]